MQHYWPLCSRAFMRGRILIFDRDHIQIHYAKNAFLLIEYKIALERKFARCWSGGSFFLSDVCLCSSF